MTPRTELDRLFPRENPMKERDFTAPDLGHPFQHCDTPQPIDFDLSPADRHTATIAKIDLERQRREANKRDADQEIASLGVVWTDDGGEAA